MCCVTLQEGKLEPSEQLGDLLKQSGDADAALSCYRSAGATTKVIEGKTLVPCMLMQSCAQDGWLAGMVWHHQGSLAQTTE